MIARTWWPVVLVFAAAVVALSWWSSRFVPGWQRSDRVDVLERRSRVLELEARDEARDVVRRVTELDDELDDVRLERLRIERKLEALDVRRRAWAPLVQLVLGAWAALVVMAVSPLVFAAGPADDVSPTPTIVGLRACFTQQEAAALTFRHHTWRELQLEVGLLREDRQLQRREVALLEEQLRTLAAAFDRQTLRLQMARDLHGELAGIASSLEAQHRALVRARRARGTLIAITVVAASAAAVAATR